MTLFDWLQVKLTYKEIDTKEPIIVPNIYKNEAAVQYYDHTVAHKLYCGQNHDISSYRNSQTSDRDKCGCVLK